MAEESGQMRYDGGADRASANEMLGENGKVKGRKAAGMRGEGAEMDIT